MSQAQDLGIYYGSNTNFLSNNIDITFKDQVQTTGEVISREYKTDWGKEFGITYRTDLSHAFSLEYVLGYQKSVTVVEQITTKDLERNTESFYFRQHYAILRPTLHYWVNDNWSFTGNTTLRMGIGGTYHEYDVQKNLFIEGKNRVFDENHLDIGIGVNYEMDMGIGAFLTYQKAILNFNGAPVEDYRPLSTLAFGLSYRIDKKKLEKFGK